jgi:hypothetical protein
MSVPNKPTTGPVAPPVIKETPPATKKGFFTPMRIAIGGTVLLMGSMILCCGGFTMIGLIMTSNTAGEVKRADALWNSGRQADAVDKYRELIKDDFSLIRDADRPTVFRRVIDFDAEHGNIDEAQQLIGKAINRNVGLSLESKQGAGLLAAIQSKQQDEARVEAEEDKRQADAAKAAEERRQAGAAQARKDRRAVSSSGSSIGILPDSSQFYLTMTPDELKAVVRSKCGLEPIKETEVEANGKQGLLIKYGGGDAELTFTFLRNLQTGEWGLLGGSINGKDFIASPR